MRQIREGVLVAAQRSVERSDMGGAVRVFVKEGRRGGGAFKDGSMVSAICCEKADEKNIQSAGAGARQNGTSAAPAQARRWPEA